jgi:mannosylglycerate synthase
MGKANPKSIVCFPFKKEDVKVFTRNIQEALSHPDVGEVLCVGYEKNKCFNEIEAKVPEIERKEKKRARLIVQKRLGEKRPGKGDGMNTGLDFFVNHTSYDRIHFYDADIVSFSRGWIERGERKAKEGYQVVRFFFPKASTDGMITWNITKCGFAYNWPDTLLPHIEQPLGGELIIERKVAEKLLKDKRVLNYSDWGIDTAYTLAFCRYKVPLYEVYIKEGKLHKLYGKLTDLYTMLMECFAIIQEECKMKIGKGNIPYKKDPVDRVPKVVREKKAFDVKGTLPLLRENWTEEEMELLALFPARIRKGMLSRHRDIDVRFMDLDAWYEVYGILLREFIQNSRAWRDLLFRLWVARVLNHTFYYASKGYDYAMKSLNDMVSSFAKRGLARQK